jgi:alkylglycerol monooxygenase
MDFLLHHAKGFGSLFYLINPYESMFETIDQLPNPSWFTKALPYFAVLIALEQLILKHQGKRGIRINDGMTSVANGLFMLIKDVFLKGALFAAYIYIYDNYRIYALPWDSVWTWIIAAIGGDLGYYWVHRAAHEINLLWAAHQVHHSSEDYNLTTALRQSFVQKFTTWPFYLPMAFFVPPTHVIVHAQFNLLYQFWIHTEVVRDLGPLEYVLNTAKHHRVHHGSNRYCLDKNYAGVLIIWDRMFGTFEWERDNEKIVYGLVDQPQTFNPLRHQAFYYGKVWQKAQSMTTWSDWISAFVKGPGWFPGTERLGDVMMVPEIQNRQKYDPKIAGWINVYAVLHFLLVFLAFTDLSRFNVAMTQTSVLAISGFLIWTVTSLGMLFDKSVWSWPGEFARSVTFLFVYGYFGAWTDFRIPSQILYSVFGASLFISTSMMAAKAFVLTKNSLKMTSADAHSKTNKKFN